MRALVAVVLTLVITGLGHAYLRRWRRAAGWIAVALGVGAVLLSAFVFPDLTPAMAETPALELARTVMNELPPEVSYPMAALRFLAAIDAYRLAMRGSPRDRGDDALTCPSCGGELDEGIEFCPWCAEPLADRSRDEDERPVKH
jgi:hypothetical protein